MDLPDELLEPLLRLSCAADPTAFWRLRQVNSRLRRLVDHLALRCRDVARALCMQAMPPNQFHSLSPHRMINVGIDYVRMWKDFRSEPGKEK